MSLLFSGRNVSWGYRTSYVGERALSLLDKRIPLIRLKKRLWNSGLLYLFAVERGYTTTEHFIKGPDYFIIENKSAGVLGFWGFGVLRLE